MPTLFDPVQAGDLQLANRIVMAPLTRNRSPDAIPRDIAITYYAQRASAGLLITEATAISQQGQGYADVPGLYGTEQLDAWKRVTDAVHAKGGKIVVQLWHVGRVSHTELQPEGGKPVAPSAITAKTKTVLIKEGVPTFVETSEPRALQAEELPGIVHSYAAAARNAVEARGFDRVACRRSVAVNDAGQFFGLERAWLGGLDEGRHAILDQHGLGLGRDGRGSDWLAAIGLQFGVRDAAHVP